MTLAESKTTGGSKCTPEATVNGSVAGEVTPVNKLQKTGKLVLLAKSPGSDEQKIKQIVVSRGAVTPELQYGVEETSETSTEEETYEEAVEIS